MASDDYWQLQDPGWLRRHYVEQNLRMVDLEEMIGCTNGELRTQLQRYGITKQADISALTKRFLRREHVKKGRPPRDIAKDLGCSEGAVRRAIDRHGLPFTKSAPWAGRFTQLRDIEWLEAQVGAGRTAASIADEIGCSSSAIGMALARSRKR